MIAGRVWGVSGLCEGCACVLNLAYLHYVRCMCVCVMDAGWVSVFVSFVWCMHELREGRVVFVYVLYGVCAGGRVYVACYVYVTCAVLYVCSVVNVHVLCVGRVCVICSCYMCGVCVACVCDMRASHDGCVDNVYV